MNLNLLFVHTANLRSLHAQSNCKLMFGFGQLRDQIKQNVYLLERFKWILVIY